MGSMHSLIFLRVVLARVHCIVRRVSCGRVYRKVMTQQQGFVVCDLVLVLLSILSK